MINKTAYGFSNYMRRLNTANGIETPDYDSNIVYYNSKRGVVVKFSKMYDGLHFDCTFTVELYRSFLDSIMYFFKVKK